uniref:Cytochrome P450 2L1 n=1 Tax=Panulirus argus TaxID=6737 RepID=CP2L1_PANAR|nr:RecName: Full=Cytochrome P450 2L1; AltName: Full=CYPIIL1 [Panulirus argus]AAB03106.1 cytochrome P450 [Panulirus argus]
MLTGALLLLLLVVIVYLLDKKPSGLPPGIWGWPLVGRMPSRSKHLADQVKQLRKKYGDIITWRIGTRVNVFLCNFKLVKTALSKFECSDRPDFYTFKLFGEGNDVGVVFSNGVMWQTHRRFILRQLRDLGMGKSRLEAAIQHEAACLVQELKKHTDQPMPLPKSINLAVLNVIWKLVADHRYSLQDQEGQYFTQLLTTTTDNMQGFALNLFNYLPWLLMITPDFVKNWMGVRVLRDGVCELKDYMKTFIKEHQATLDPSNPKDLLDAYLIDLQERKEDPLSTMNIETVRAVIMDLFGAGTETTSTMIRWTILYLMKYPEVQAKIQREIDAAVPRGTLPSLEHKDKLAYFEATIHEVHRIVSLVPLGVSHYTNQDTELAGYRLPKGTVVMSHLECCHRDPSYWEKPNEFYPEHFLDDQGKFVKREHLVNFSVGRRVCVGESLARMELFVFLSAILQNFTFSAPKGEVLHTEKDPQQMLFSFPKPYQVIIRERE